MYNLRYHIASLVSVFLALALGLVLGGLIVQRGTFDDQRAALVEGLRKEFRDLRVESKELRSENERLDALTAALYADWAKDRLNGRSVVVLTNSGRSEGMVSVTQAITGAGGSVVTVTVVKPRLGLDGDDAELRSLVESIAPDPERPLESLVASLAAEWFTPVVDRPITDALVAADVLTVTGMQETAASGFVDIAVAEGDVDSMGIDLASAAGALDVPTVAAETLDSKSGLASAAADAQVSACNTLGTQVGSYSLVALLTGADPGFYGDGAGVDALFPPIPADQASVAR